MPLGLLWVKFVLFMEISGQVRVGHTEKKFCFSMGKSLLHVGKSVSVTAALGKIYCDVIVRALIGFVMLTGTTCRQVPG